MQGLFDFRNALYYGKIHDKRPEGVGLIVSDEGEVLLARQKQGKIDGQYFYAGDGIKIYGSMKEGNYHGFNLFQLKDFTAYCQFNQGNVEDIVVLHRNGRLVGRDQRVGGIPQHTSLNEFIEQIINQSDCFNILRVNHNRTFYGIVGEKGIGFQILSQQLYSLGMYSDGQLSGIGKLLLPHQIQQGIFKDGHLYSVGMKWNVAKQSYYFADWKKSGLTVLSRGKDKYPWDQIKKIRRQFHLRAVNFVNDWMVVGKMLDLYGVLEQVQKMQPLQVSLEIEVEVSEDEDMTRLTKTSKTPKTPIVLILDNSIQSAVKFQPAQQPPQINRVDCVNEPSSPVDLLSAIREYQRLNLLKKLRR